MEDWTGRWSGMGYQSQPRWRLFVQTMQDAQGWSTSPYREVFPGVFKFILERFLIKRQHTKKKKHVSEIIMIWNG